MYTTYIIYIHITMSSQTTVGSLLITNYKYQINKDNKSHYAVDEHIII